MLNLERSRQLGYFEDLNERTREVVKEMLLVAFHGLSKPDCYPYDDADLTHDIECRSRDGFIPFDHNRGGIRVKGFSDLNGIWGGGYYPRAKKSNEYASELIEHDFKDISQSFFDANSELLTRLGVTLEQCNYHDLEELGKTHAELKDASRDIGDLENEFLGSENSSVMYELQFLYHGENGKGVHSASIAAALNFEAPYHRAGRNEMAKEVEITWRTLPELKKKLTLALEKTCKAVF